MKVLIQIILIFSSFQCFSQTTDNQDSSKSEAINRNYIPKNLEESFVQINSFWHDTTKTELKKLTEDEFSGRLHHGFGTWMRNNWGLWGGSSLAKYFNEKGIFHPDDMSGIILTSYHRRLNNKPIDLEEQIKFYQAFWEKAKANELKKVQEEKSSADKNLKWLSDRKIPLLKLFKADSRYVNMTCDSTLTIKQTDKDSIFLWTMASESAYGDNHPFGYKYLERAIKDKRNEFGRFSYIKGLNYQGSISFVNLKRNVFKVSKDSLFEFSEFYKINNDSVAFLKDKVYSFEGKKRDRKKYSKILSSNSYYKFKLIYCNSMFRDSNFVYYNQESKDTIRLTGYWLIGTKKYYRIDIENKTEDGTKTSYGYRFDEFYRFVDYEECDKVEMELISYDKNLIKSEEDE